MSMKWMAAVLLAGIAFAATPAQAEDLCLRPNLYCLSLDGGSSPRGDCPYGVYNARIGGGAYGDVFLMCTYTGENSDTCVATIYPDGVQADNPDGLMCYNTDHEVGGQTCAIGIKPEDSFQYEYFLCQ